MVATVDDGGERGGAGGAGGGEPVGTGRERGAGLLVHRPAAAVVGGRGLCGAVCGVDAAEGERAFVPGGGGETAAGDTGRVGLGADRDLGGFGGAGQEGVGFGFVPSWREVGVGVRWYLLFVPVGALLGWAIGFTGLHQGPWLWEKML